MKKLILVVSLVFAGACNGKQVTRPVEGAPPPSENVPRRPIARINATATAGSDWVVLDGSASTGRDDATLAYAWRIEAPSGGPQPTLEDTDRARARAKFRIGGLYRVVLVVSDGALSSDEASVIIDADIPPVAVAGRDRTVRINEDVTLDCSLSDPWNVTCEWDIVEGGPIDGFERTAKTPTFRATRPHATYGFSLVVTDRWGRRSAPAGVAVRVLNSKPVVNVADKRLHNRVVPLVASVRDADGDQVSVRWEIVASPAGSRATIARSNELAAELDADVFGDYEVQVTASDGFEESVATMKVTPYNAGPGARLASPEPAEAPHSCEAVSGSLRCKATATLSIDVLDDDDNTLDAQWRLVSVPTAQAPSAATTAFCARAPVAVTPGTWRHTDCLVEISTVGATAIAGRYTFRATVTDPQGAAREIDADIVVKNKAPTIAVASSEPLTHRTTVTSPGVYKVEAIGTLEASTKDDDGDQVESTWTIAAKPTGVDCTLGAPTENRRGINCSVTSADRIVLAGLVLGSVVVQIEARDKNGGVTTERVNFSVRNAQPALYVTQPGAAAHTTTVLGKGRKLEATAMLEAYAVDGDGDPIAQSWRVVKKPPGVDHVFGAQDGNKQPVTFSITSADTDALKRFISDDGYEVEFQACDLAGCVTAPAPVRVAVRNTAPAIPALAVPGRASRLCDKAAGECWVRLTVPGAGAAFADTEADPVELRFELAAPPSARTWRVEQTGDVIRIIEHGQFDFVNGPFLGAISLRLTATDFLGATATTTTSVTVENSGPGAPISTLRPDPLHVTCGSSGCTFVLDGDVQPLLNWFTADGDDVRFNVSYLSGGTSSSGAVLLTPRSGTFTGCVQDPYQPWRYVPGTPVPFTEKWVLLTPDSTATHAALVAQDWSGAVSPATLVPLSLSVVGSQVTPGCAPEITFN